MRSLGDDYVKSGNSHLLSIQRMCKPHIPTNLFTPEFRRHKDVTNPVYIMGFLTQWKMYLDQLSYGSDGRAYRGKKLDPTVLEKVGL